MVDRAFNRKGFAWFPLAGESSPNYRIHFAPRREPALEPLAHVVMVVVGVDEPSV